jgi:putative flavoprotein involved in K+ transport
MAHATVIIGGGPAGLAAAACLSRRGVPYRVLDTRGEPGGAYRDIYGAIVLASPRAIDALPGLPLPAGGDYVTVGEYRAYLGRYAEHHRIAVDKATVTAVAREGRAFRVDTDTETMTAPAVVVATGLWSFPVVPALAGTPAVPVIHACAWRGPEAHPGERVLVVGGGSSAVEIAEHSARAGRVVFVAARRPIKTMPRNLLGVDVHYWVAPLARLPTWLDRRRCERPPTLPATDLGFSALCRSGAIAVRPALQAVEGSVARFAGGATEVVDLVVLATGFRHEAPFLPPEVARAPAGHVQAREGESVSWPGLFVLGAPCAVSFESEFLRGAARDAEIVAGKIAARVAA